MTKTILGKLHKIGEVASFTGLPVKTIRYYEELGLLSPVVTRASSGYRLFDSQVLKRLDFIKRAQSLGMSLKEIQEFLEIHDRGELPCHEVKQHIQSKLKAIDRQIAALETLRSELLELLSDWKEPKSDDVDEIICPNIQSHLDETSEHCH
ncbi:MULTISPECIES: heavy metal-responsive transcriptional regulator [Floridanema]|jgi:DNA-binding transcriptional MerR regulator|uniref:Heavy metal-responsive transcriptional regulator n=2 Tax=Floridanema TaxID=3396149 RepID=A0ABV4X997_9CYAN